MMSLALVIASLIMSTFAGADPDITAGQKAVLNIVQTPRDCTQCVAWQCPRATKRLLPWNRASLAKEIRKYSAVQEKLSEYQRQEKFPLTASLFISRCPAATAQTCRKKTTTFRRCGNCYVYWPWQGYKTVVCSDPGRRCDMRCTCPGNCRPYGQRWRWVLLYCPYNKFPWTWRRVPYCTNCCCI